MRSSSSTEPISSNLKKRQPSRILAEQKLRLPKPRRHAPCRRTLVSNVLHSRILARFSYKMSHSGLMVIYHVPHSRILARLSYRIKGAPILF
jgi:hypothetical protein